MASRRAEASSGHVRSLRRAGYDETFISEVARVMEYKAAYDLYRDDILYDE